MAECSCIIHFQYSRKYCNGCNFFATECVMLCPTLTKLPLEYSLFSCHKLTKYDFGVQFGTKRSQVQILSPRPERKPCIISDTGLLLCLKMRFSPNFPLMTVSFACFHTLPVGVVLPPSLYHRRRRHLYRSALSHPGCCVLRCRLRPPHWILRVSRL